MSVMHPRDRFSIINLTEGTSVNITTNIFEILTWKSKVGVSDEKMIDAVNFMVIDLKELKGFLNQTLYKDDDGTWVDIYYWETEKDAHDSNESMADKDSFKNLISMIEPDSVSIKVMNPLQSSGDICFK